MKHLHRFSIFQDQMSSRWWWHALLVIAGEQGSAKTVLTKILRALVDPDAAPARALPREDHELFISTTNGHVLAFDNLSGLPAWASDSLCRLASGGGFAVGQLYSNQDEVLFDAARPVILNGIEDIVIRPDLAERAIFLALSPITHARRRSEKELWREFDAARPRLFGALLDMAAHGLRRLPRIHLERLPLMANFALWPSACETALWPAGTFSQAYDANRRAAIERVIDADTVAACVRDDGQLQFVGWKRVRPCSPRCRYCERWILEKRGPAKKSPRARRPTAPGADAPPHIGH